MFCDFYSSCKRLFQMKKCNSVLIFGLKIGYAYSKGGSNKYLSQKMHTPVNSILPYKSGARGLK